MKQIVLYYVGTAVTFNKKAEIDPGDKCRLSDWSVLWPYVLLSASMFLCKSSKVSKV